MVLPTCQPIFTVLVQFLDRNRKPHLNQMQHVPVDHAPGDTLHQFAGWNRIEGHPDTLPTTSPSRHGRPSLVRTTHLKGSLWRSSGMRACPAACSSCSFCPMEVSP